MNTTINYYLQNILDSENRDSIRFYVAEEALNNHEDPISFLMYLTEHGCESGIVSDLIYYSDIYAFHDEHYDEIDEIRQESGFNTIKNRDLRSQHVWFSLRYRGNQILLEFIIWLNS
jgi:hypothetical protein